MQFYTVSDAYINYLKTVDPKIPDNYYGKRPYVGILLEINGHKYLAPLTSYKQKQDTLETSNPTIFKIHEKGNVENKLGLIHLNNMIPVIESEISVVDISGQEVKYRNLLQKQLEFIKGNQDIVKKKAASLYGLITVNKHKFFCGLSCDFKLLEKKYGEFGKPAAVIT